MEMWKLLNEFLKFLIKDGFCNVLYFRDFTYDCVIITQT